MLASRLLLAALLLVSTSCAGLLYGPNPPPKSQLEIRQLQTREIDGADGRAVMKAVLNVLQDDGYMVRNAVLELGLLSAAKEVDVTDPSEAFFKTLFMGEDGRWQAHTVIECTVNVSEHGQTVRVRASFQVKTYDNAGGVRRIATIDDPQFYQTFFSKVDKGVFLQKEQL